MRPDPVDIVGQIGALRRYARVLTRDPDAADDLVQSALLRAQEHRATFKTGADPRVWLMAILHNLFIDRRRSTQATAQREQAWAATRPAFAPPAGENAARLAQLQRGFLTLTADQHEALHLVAIEGLTMAEAAAILDLPQGTVMSRIGRARAALRAFEDATHTTGPAPAIRLVGGRDDQTT